MSYSVQWTTTAELDLANIINYIAEDKVSAAKSVLKKLKQLTSKLVTFPHRGRKVPELKRLGIINYYELLHKPWRIIYRIEGKLVYVLAVLDSRRNLEDLLLDRFLIG